MSLTDFSPAPDARERPTARQRILVTATELFYRVGIRAVGIDRIIAEAQVAKATFYHHFPTKDALVCAYLQTQHDLQSGMLTGIAAAAPDPRAAIVALLEAVAGVACAPGFRGCTFVNAAVEYPDPDSPVRQVVETHRRWFRGQIADLAGRAGHPDPDGVSGILVALRDGITVSPAIDPTGNAEAIRRSLPVTLAALLPAGPG